MAEQTTHNAQVLTQRKAKLDELLKSKMSKVDASDAIAFAVAHEEANQEAVRCFAFTQLTNITSLITDCHVSRTRFKDFYTHGS